VTMAYNVAGQKTQQVYANGITTDYAYNENGWLSEIKADHDIMHLQMEYDAIGNMTKRVDALNAERTESYGYDVISQLTSFKRGTTVDKSYQFDLLGNRIKTLENGVVTNYTSNNVNAYTNITGGLNFTPQYDDNGNMLNDDKHTYQYDYNNKLVSVDETVGIYKYDALGRRIAKNNILFYYKGHQMIEENTSTMITSYLCGNNIDELLQMKKGNDVFYYHKNHLESVVALSDNMGTISERIEYDIYGKPSFFDTNGNEISQSGVGNNVLFANREYDVETAQYYYRARNLNSNTGRFLQNEPLVYIDGLNTYNYVLCNPIYYKDKTGQAAGVAAERMAISTAEGLSRVAQLERIYQASAPVRATNLVGWGITAALSWGEVGWYTYKHWDEITDAWDWYTRRQYIDNLKPVDPGAGAKNDYYPKPNTGQQTNGGEDNDDCEKNPCSKKCLFSKPPQEREFQSQMDCWCSSKYKQLYPGKCKREEKCNLKGVDNNGQSFNAPNVGKFRVTG